MVLLAMPAALQQVTMCLGLELCGSMPSCNLAMSNAAAACLETVFLDFEGGHLIQHCLNEYQELVIVPAGQLDSLRTWHQPATSICRCR